MGAVFEEVRLAAEKQASSLKLIQIGVETDPAKRDYDFHFFQSGKFAIEKDGTLCQFLRQGLIVGWRASDRGGDVQIFEFQSVIAVGRSGLVGKSSLIEHRIHELAGGVAGEGAAGSVRAVRAGSQSHNQNTRAGIAESRHGLAPVLPVTIGAALLTRDFLAVSDQARATSATDNFAIQNREPRHLAITSHARGSFPRDV